MRCAAVRNKTAPRVGHSTGAGILQVRDTGLLALLAVTSSKLQSVGRNVVGATPPGSLSTAECSTLLDGRY